MRKLLHTVTPDDVGKDYIIKKGYPGSGLKGQVSVRDIVGYFLKCDIGKRIYDVNGVMQIENDEQLKKRLASEKANQRG